MTEIVSSRVTMYSNRVAHATVPSTSNAIVKTAIRIVRISTSLRLGYTAPSHSDPTPRSAQRTYALPNTTTTNPPPLFLTPHSLARLGLPQLPNSYLFRLEWQKKRVSSSEVRLVMRDLSAEFFN